jgi:excisionase family DNA binding protein
MVLSVFDFGREEKQMPETKELSTLEEMAARLRVNQSWLYRQTKRHDAGSIPRLKVGKYLRFNEAEVMAWIKKQNQGGNDE